MRNVEACASSERLASPGSLNDAFNIMDENESGSLSLREFRRACRDFGFALQGTKCDDLFYVLKGPARRRLEIGLVYLSKPLAGE